MKNQLFFSMFLLLSVLVVAHITNITNATAPPCSEVTNKAASCLSFAMGKEANAKPSQACCNGLKALAQTVKTVNDKKAICRCLEASVKNFKGVQDKFLGQIPTACKITVGFPVSTSVNCETIH